MKYKKFSIEKFERLFLRKGKTDSLDNALDKMITSDIHNHIFNKYLDIIDKLNNLGHKLKEEINEIGDVIYKSDSNNNSFKFGIGFDICVSIGFRDTKSLEELEKEEQEYYKSLDIDIN